MHVGKEEKNRGIEVVSSLRLYLITFVIDFFGNPLSPLLLQTAFTDSA